MTQRQVQPVWGPALEQLVQRGLLDGDAVLDGLVVVEPASRSNEVGIVRVAGQATHVLKRPEIGFDGVDPLIAEITAYGVLAGAGEGAGDSPSLAPALVASFGDVLVIEMVDGARSLHEALGGPSESTLLAGLGRLLADVHSLPLGAGVVARRPWVLDLAKGTLPTPLAADPALHEMAESISRDDALRGALHHLDQRWRSTAFIHGDVKFDNVLVPRSAPAPAPVLIDWELAGAGWPAWDLAGIVDGLVVPATQCCDTATALDWRSSAQPALDAYRRHCTSTAPTSDDVELATVGRLVQSALQLAAMRHLDPECESMAAPVLAAAAELAQLRMTGAQAA